jgi:hypothetical protein
MEKLWLPNDFLYDAPPRIIGTETEYGLRLYSASGSRPDSDIHGDELGASLQKNAHSFLPNGGKAYLDMGSPEYATPETIDTAVACELAGENIILAAVKTLVLRRNRIFGCDTRASLHKALVASKDYRANKSRGYHENYLIPRTARDRIEAVLLPFLFTRSIWAGAGSARIFGSNLHLLEIKTAQKQPDITLAKSFVTTHTKPMIVDRDEAHSDEDWYRLQIVGGDANISPWQIQQKLCITSAIIRLAEHATMSKKLARSLFPHNIQGVSKADSTRSLHQAFVCKDGKKRSSLDVQIIYLEELLKLSERIALPTHETLAIREFAEVLDDLKYPDLVKLSDRLDWAYKTAYVQRVLDSDTKHEQKVNKIKALDNLFGDISNQGHIERYRAFNRLRISPEEVKKAEKRPPANTRAAIRGHLIASHIEKIESVNWGDVVLRDSKRLTFGNPYDTRLPRLPL